MPRLLFAECNDDTGRYGWMDPRLLERRKRDSFPRQPIPALPRGLPPPTPPPLPPATPGARTSAAVPAGAGCHDLCVCHSEEDISEAQLLVSYLESQPVGLRCFLMLRLHPGGSIPSELCQAVRSSHCWALLITRSFLLDPGQYPMELRFYYYIDITADQQRGFQQVHRTVLHYLEELCQVDSSKLSSPSSVDTETGLSEEGHRTTHSELSSTDSG
ncbi:toll/interleukin-1 receptor domain-containing adapter protein-like [Acipenser oxyrinchus oxyrinchus]|uniref:Toll/interleukin-1 receptor domain-containing adapter protein-like n=1 Tax=Acipenser oxyrinchus oxyrinchus TaxID=40147 RepID=A0AAD8CV99_ACIOX|nr:toll/interleukin-1 receptor domain-containing adapter protein-like [Acipenser oxyrinchus oxyrinchus]